MKTPFLGLLLMAASTAAAKSIAIHPLGDSITHGMDDNGYRLGVARALAERKIDFHFVGTLEHGGHGLSERAHDGHDGWVTDQLIANIDPWLERFRPDVVLLMIGANDIEAGVGVDALLKKHKTLLDRIVAKSPATWVLVSEISVIRDPKFDQRAQEFNQRLAEMVRARGRGDERLVFVPMHDALTTHDLRDLDHPTPAGNEKMARRWMESLGPVVTKL